MARANPVAALRAARELIADSECWTCSAPARYCRQGRGRGKSRHGAEWLPTHATDRSSALVCRGGALQGLRGAEWRAGFPLLDAAAVRLFGVGIGRANDGAGISHADVLRAYDLAIRAAAEGAA